MLNLKDYIIALCLGLVWVMACGAAWVYLTYII